MVVQEKEGDCWLSKPLNPCRGKVHKLHRCDFKAILQNVVRVGMHLQTMYLHDEI